MKIKKVFTLYSALIICLNLNAQNTTHSPQWVKDAVFYEIYPQSFYDTNGDGIGDINGITKKLDYVQSLGVNAIWLNPFYESPFRDAGYDVSDYYKVAARYGTMDDVKKLFSEVHKRNMKIIIDFVPGHTSIDHPWFKESAKAEKNKYSNWYIWTNSTWTGVGKNDGGANFISGFSNRDGKFLTNFFWHQPALNFGFGKPDSTKKWQLPTNHPDVMALREEMKNILRFWLDAGCDGFRVDMAGSIIRKDSNGEGFKFWQEVRKMLDTDYPESFMVSEWSNPKDAIKAGFTSDFLHWIPQYDDLFRSESNRSLNNVSKDGHSYFDIKGKGDITSFLNEYLSHYTATKDKGYISIPVSNHDLSRINANRTQADLEVIYAFLMYMPGVPFIYYGDEIGMKQLSNTPSKEGSYPPRSGARTPMQWNNEINKGFSTTSDSKNLWLPVDVSEKAPNVSDGERDPASLLNKMKMLISIRKKEIALHADAGFEVLYAEKNKYPFVFMRKAGGQAIVIALNPSGEDVKVELPFKSSKKSQLLVGKDVQFQSSKGKTLVSMKGVSYGVYKLN